MIALKLTQVGDALALVLPEESEAEEQLEEARRIMHRRRAALRVLAQQSGDAAGGEIA